MIETLAILGLLLSVLTILIPITVYLSAKLGAYGFLKGKQKFEEDNHQPCSKEKLQ